MSVQRSAAAVRSLDGQHVGFCGLGDIGLPMATRLLDTGLTLRVYNRTRAKTRPLVERGAVDLTTPAELTRECTIVVTCLHGPDADREVYLGTGGLLSVAAEGVVFVNTSTIGPAVARELAAAVHAAGGDYLDATLFTGRAAAAAGELVMAVAGEPAVIERTRPLLGLLATTIQPLARIGAAQVLKLAYNYQWAVESVALAQGVRMALAGGADAQSVIAVLGAAGSRSHPTSSYLERMATEQTEPRATLRTLAKDLDLAVALAADMGTPRGVGVAAASSFHATLAAGFREFDVPSLMREPS